MRASSAKCVRRGRPRRSSGTPCVADHPRRHAVAPRELARAFLHLAACVPSPSVCLIADTRAVRRGRSRPARAPPTAGARRGGTTTRQRRARSRAAARPAPARRVNTDRDDVAAHRPSRSSRTASGRTTTCTAPSAVPSRRLHRPHGDSAPHGVATRRPRTVGRRRPGRSRGTSRRPRVDRPRQTRPGAPICTIRPSRMIATRCCDRERFVVIVRDVDRRQRVRSRSARISPSSRRRHTRSSAPSGSSSISRRGETASARASATRCCSPPESDATRRARSVAQADEVEHLVDAASACRAIGTRAIRSPNSTLPATSRCGNSAYSWNIEPEATFVRRHAPRGHRRPSARAGVEGLQAGDRAQQRRLARAAGPEQRDGLARADLEIDTGERDADRRSAPPPPRPGASTAPRAGVPARVRSRGSRPRSSP